MNLECSLEDWKNFLTFPEWSHRLNAVRMFHKIFPLYRKYKMDSIPNLSKSEILVPSDTKNLNIPLKPRAIANETYWMFARRYGISRRTGIHHRRLKTIEKLSREIYDYEVKNAEKIDIGLYVN